MRFTVNSCYRYLEPQFNKQTFTSLLRVNHQMSAEIKALVFQKGVTLSTKRDHGGTWRFLDDLVWTVRKMPSYIVSAIREVILISVLEYDRRTVLSL